MDFNDVAKLLLEAEYKFAKSMPTMPHWYTLAETWDSREDFEKVVQYIRDSGYTKRFGRKIFTYIDVNGHQYWSYGDPVPDTILINKAEVRRFSTYDKIADGYDELFTDPVFKQEDQDLIEKLQITGRVLDVGCGTGLLLDYLKPVDYVGIDPSSQMLEHLKEKHPDYSDKVICTPAENFYDIGKFDTIVSLYGSPNYIPPEHIDRLVGMLAPNGKATFMYYAPDYKVYTYNKTGIAPKHYNPPKAGEPFTNYQLVTYENI